MTIDDCAMTRDELWSEVQRLQNIQRELIKECKCEVKKAQDEVKQWKVLCNRWKEDINAVSEKLYWFQNREPLVRKLVLEAQDQRLCDCDDAMAMVGRLDVVQAAIAVRDFGPCGGGE